MYTALSCGNICLPNHTIHSIEMFSAFLLLVEFSLSTASINCKTSGSLYGVAHLGHVYKHFTVDRLATCYSACKSQPACQSLSYNLADKTCYFNHIATRSEDLMKMESFVYAENPNRGKTSAFKPCFLPVISMTY